MGVLILLLTAVSLYLAYRWRQAEAARTELSEQIDQRGSALDQASAQAAELEQSVALLKEALEAKENALRASQKSVEALQKGEKSSYDRVAELENRLRRTEEKLAKAEQMASTRTDERDRARAELNQSKRSAQQEREQFEARVAGLEQGAGQLEAALTEAQERIREQQVLVHRLETQLEEEGRASLAVIKERGQMREQLESLRREREKLQEALDSANRAVDRLSRVQPGDLVPFSRKLKPAQITFQEPFDKDEELPRRFGPVAVMVLVSEIGAADDAFVMPGQNVEPMLRDALIRNVLKWSFTAPELDGLRVKTWQTFLVSR